MGYAENKAASRRPIVGETMTDQAGAAATDINIIVEKMRATGTFPAGAKQPMYVDMSQLPDNLRDMLEMSRNIESQRNNLPEALRHLSTAELLAKKPEEISLMISEQERYRERHDKLPAHMKSLSRQDVLSLTDEQYTNIITPPQPAVKQETKT